MFPAYQADALLFSLLYLGYDYQIIAAVTTVFAVLSVKTQNRQIT